MRLGSDCTTWLPGADRFCGRDAVYVRYDTDGARVLDVVCVDHRQPGDTMIPVGAERAPRATFWQERAPRRER